MAENVHIMSMENVHSRNIAIAEGSASQSVEEMQKLSISIQKVAPGDPSSSLDQKIQRLRESYESSKTKPIKAKIQKVPFPLRGHKHFKKYFEPRAVALGPIHHGKPGYELAEEYKLRLAKFFVVESGCDEKTMYKAVEKEIKSLRECYEEEMTKCYGDEELAWMFFLDGSSLLGFITCLVEGKLEEMNIKKDLAAFGQQDTFLIENQLPFQLLELLIDQSSKNADRWIKNIHDFTHKVRKHTITLKKSRIGEGSVPGNRTVFGYDCPHLLHLLRQKLLVDEETKKPAGQNCSNADVEAHRRPFAAKKGYFRCHRKPKDDSDHEPTSHRKPKDDSDHEPTFRNIKELKSAGIRVRGNKSRCLTHVYFKSSKFCPTLYMPSIVVDDWTAPKFLNMVAYEMCPDFHNDYGITSYVCFLDALIDQPEDVKELRDANILYNILGSDEEVATLFNEISTDLVPDEQAYSKVKKQIQRQYNNVWTTWVALAYNKHFSNPWTLLALLGALLGLALSAIQAIKALDESCTKICDK